MKIQGKIKNITKRKEIESKQYDDRKIYNAWLLLMVTRLAVKRFHVPFPCSSLVSGVSVRNLERDVSLRPSLRFLECVIATAKARDGEGKTHDITLIHSVPDGRRWGHGEKG